MTGRMVYLTAVTLQEYTETLSRELLRLGLMHFVDIRTIEPSIAGKDGITVHRDDRDGRQTVLTNSRKRVESILNIGGFPRPTVGNDTVGAVETEGGDDSDRIAGDLESRIEAVREKQRIIQQQITRMEDVRRHMDEWVRKPSRVGQGISSGGTFLEVHAGSVPVGKLESLEQKLALYPAVVSHSGQTGDRAFIVVVSMKRNISEIEKILTDHGFEHQKAPAPSSDETVQELDVKLGSLRSEQRILADSVKNLIGGKRPDLEQIWRNLRVRELETTIETRFADTHRAVVASGWIPESKRKQVEAVLLKATGGHITLEWHLASEFLDGRFHSGSPEASADDGGRHEPAIRPTVPSQLKNPQFLGPFQKLVTNYGIPAYGTIDPTVLVAPAYLAMFGLMFGDAGHGLILVLAGIAGRLWSRRLARNPVSRGGLVSSIPYLSRLILWCGSSAILTGVLFGSYFGMPLFPALWFNYHGVVSGEPGSGAIRSIFDVLKITIYFGIAIIGTGLLINWVNLAKQKRWLSLLLDNTGILGGVMYAVGVVLASQFASTGFRSLPDFPILIWIEIACAGLIFLKAPLHDRHGNPLFWLMEWVISLLEVFSGYLANTLSFMRVAGLGIAHVTLMIAFFQIAKMASPVGWNLWSILILVLGNALVIVLEGLSAGIQSLRLNYYEFFSKHFQPTGVEYKPISMEEP